MSDFENDIVVVLGDDATINIQLTKNNATFVIDPTATILARLVGKDRVTALTSTVEVTETPARSVWATSFIVVIIPEATTNELASFLECSRTGIEEAFLEIQVDDGGKRSYFIDVFVSNSTIE